MYRQMAAIAGDFDLSSLKQMRLGRRSAARCDAPGCSRSDRHRDHRRHRLDRDDPHLHLAHARARARGATGYAIPGYRPRCSTKKAASRPAGGPARGERPTGCRYLADERQKNYVQNGWNVTGDAYLMDQDGYFFYQARTDDMIISAGYNIAGPEVEGVLLAHPAVPNAAWSARRIRARHDRQAFVVFETRKSRNGETAKALQEHVKSVIAPYKYPRAIEFVDTLPRTETGKLQRFKLEGTNEHSAEPAAARLGAAQRLPPTASPRRENWCSSPARSAGPARRMEGALVRRPVPPGAAEHPRSAGAGQGQARAHRAPHLVRARQARIPASLKAVGAAYRELMGRHYPTMAVVQVSGLVEDEARLEIEATAVIP